MPRLSILIVDDFEEIQILVAHWLRSRGHQVTCASTGEAAIKLLEQERFDLVITDVMMPDGDGLDVIREFKHQRSPTRVLAITGGGKYVTSAECARLAAELGADAIVLKPFDEQQFTAGFEHAISPTNRLIQ